MKRSLLTLAFLMVAPAAAAEENHRDLGFQVDVGVPDGFGAGVSIRPEPSWLRLNLSGTFNGIAPGIRGGITLDAVDRNVSPSFTLEAGHAFAGVVPGVDRSPNVGYDYCNLHVGLEFGKRNRWRFFVHAGPSFVSGNVSNIGPIMNGVDHSTTLIDPTVNGWLIPTAKIGFAMFF